MTLSEKTCEPCRVGGAPLPAQRTLELLAELGGGWNLDVHGHLRQLFVTEDFAASLALAQRIGALADREGHHPDLLVRWGQLGIELWTHKLDGLSESDFILAAKIQKLASS